MPGTVKKKVKVDLSNLFVMIRDEAQAYFSVGIDELNRIADECSGIFRVGNQRRYISAKLEQWILDHAE